MKFLKWALIVLMAIILAVALFAYRMQQGVKQMSVYNGDWSTIVNTGSENANAIERATIAIVGLLASTKKDSIYYRITSVNGEPLSSSCTYRLEGGQYNANWWSVTAYGWDNHLLPNPQKIYSVNSAQVGDQWRVRLSAEPQDGMWIPLGPAHVAAKVWSKRGDHDFDLLFRLYTPSDVYLNSPQSAPVPKLIKESCQ